MKVKINDYYDWVSKFNRGKFKNQRYGQSFYNYFWTKGTPPHPELFYEQDRDKAIEIIFDKYIKDD